MTEATTGIKFYIEFNVYNEGGSVDSLQHCLKEAKDSAEALAWAESKKHLFVNREPDSGPVVKSADQISIYLVPLEDHLDNLWRNGDYLD